MTSPYAENSPKNTQPAADPHAVKEALLKYSISRAAEETINETLRLLGQAPKRYIEHLITQTIQNPTPSHIASHAIATLYTAMAAQVIKNTLPETFDQMVFQATSGGIKKPFKIPASASEIAAEATTMAARIETGGVASAITSGLVKLTEAAAPENIAAVTPIKRPDKFAIAAENYIRELESITAARAVLAASAETDAQSKRQLESWIKTRVQHMNSELSMTVGHNITVSRKAVTHNFGGENAKVPTFSYPKPKTKNYSPFHAEFYADLADKAALVRYGQPGDQLARYKLNGFHPIENASSSILVFTNAGKLKQILLISGDEFTQNTNVKHIARHNAESLLDKAIFKAQEIDKINAGNAMANPQTPQYLMIKESFLSKTPVTVDAMPAYPNTQSSLINNSDNTFPTKSATSTMLDLLKNQAQTAQVGNMEAFLKFATANIENHQRQL